MHNRYHDSHDHHHGRHHPHHHYEAEDELLYEFTQDLP